MTDEQAKGRGRNTWDYDVPDGGLVRGDRPTDVSADQPTGTDSGDTVQTPVGGPPPLPSSAGLDGRQGRGGRRVSRRGTYLMWLGLASAAIVAVVIVVLTRGGGEPEVELTLVPTLEALDEQEAAALLEADGLALGTVTTEARGDVDAGIVLDQQPPAGSEVEPGVAIDLVVAAPVETAVVPVVTDLTESEAVAALAGAGLESVTTQGVESTVEEGAVVGQAPEAGTEVAVDTEVTLMVSSGPGPQPVPNLAGLAAAEAQTRLETIGWEVAVVEQNHDTVAAGQVIDTSPAATTELELGETVELRVSLGPAAVEVPDVRGVNAFVAGQTLSDLGLRLKPSKDECEGEPGIIARQRPKAGTEVEPGSSVTVCIAVEPTPTPVPPRGPTATPVPPRQTPTTRPDTGDDGCDPLDTGCQ